MSRYVPPHLCESARPGQIAKVMEWGFTLRQARFLTHVLVFSGVFLERQYCAFAGITHDPDLLAGMGQSLRQRTDHVRHAAGFGVGMKFAAGQ